MRPVAWFAIVCGVLMLAALALPASARPAAWGGIFGVFFLFVLVGICSMRTGILAKVRNRGDADRPEVALTYDDGPDPDTTGPLLDLLKERGAEATFFVVGDRVRAHPGIVRRCHDEGHQIGNHSDKHSNRTNWYFYGRLRKNIEACQAAVVSAAGVAPRCYRPPMGLVNHSLGPVTRDLGLEPIAWSVRSFDTVARPAEKVAERVLRRCRPGAIVLLHDGGMERERVLEITRRILDGLDHKGLKPVRLDRLAKLGSLWQASPVEEN